jgi:hypothetical protein
MVREQLPINPRNPFNQVKPIHNSSPNGSGGHLSPLCPETVVRLASDARSRLYALCCLILSRFSPGLLMGEYLANLLPSCGMDEGRKRVLGITAAIRASLYMQTADDLFGGPQGSPRTKVIAASVQVKKCRTTQICGQLPCSVSYIGLCAEALGYSCYFSHPSAAPLGRRFLAKID